MPVSHAHPALVQRSGLRSVIVMVMMVMVVVVMVMVMMAAG
jgi:predicted RND superfamily exporter protein